MNSRKLITVSFSLVTGLAITSSDVVAQGGSASRSVSDSSVLNAVLAVDAGLAAAESRSDTAAMAKFFDPDYLSVAPDGEMLSSRARLFRIARAAKATDSTQVLTEPWIRQVRPDAVLITRSVRIWGVRHGNQTEGSMFRVSRLYVRRSDQWRLLFQQGTPLSEEHISGTGPGAPRR